MRETFTTTLRAALTAAQAAARVHNQDFVGTEHLMLGLLDHDGAVDASADGGRASAECEACRVMRESHAEPRPLRTALDAALPRGANPPVVHGDLPLSPKAQRVVNGALVKAQAMREPRVSTRLLLLSLLDEVPPAVRSALDACGVDTDTLSQRLAVRPGRAED